MMNLRPLLKELGLLVLLLAITWFFCYLVLHPEHETKFTIDFNYHDTYFVIKDISIFSPCLLLLYPIYFVRVVITKYRNSSLNFVSLGIFILTLIKVIHLMAIIGMLFLPLKAAPLSPDIIQGQEIKPLKNQVDFMDPIQQFFITIAILLVIILVISAFLTGKNGKPVYDANKI